MNGSLYIGSALGIPISYSANHSILWAITHGILSWLYVVYFALFHGTAPCETAVGKAAHGGMYSAPRVSMNSRHEG